MSKIADSAEAQALFDKVAGLSTEAGNPRIKEIVRRVVEDACRIVEDLDVTPSEFDLGHHEALRARCEQHRLR